MNKVFVFPGQGSQYLGMGKDLYDNFPIARGVFEEVDEVLNQKLSSIIFGDDLELLTMTENTQPALMATSIATLRVMCELSGKPIDDMCRFVAGHSLGEYTALCAAASISLGDTARLLKTRGLAMQSACASGNGAMVACLGVGVGELEYILPEINEIGVCQIANDNGAEQVVVSGELAAIDAFEHIVKNVFGKKVVRLKVSAPFHSSLMLPAAEKMKEALSKVEINIPLVPIIPNVVVDSVEDVSTIVDSLVAQVAGTVRWRETMDFIASKNVNVIYEIGPGKVLTTLAKRSIYDFTTHNISSVSDIESYINSVQ